MTNAATKITAKKTAKKATKKVAGQGATFNKVRPKRQWNISVKPLLPLAWGLGVLLLAVFVYQAVLNVKLPVKDIYIDGPFTHVQRSFFEGKLKSLVGRHILSIDIDGLKKELEQHGLVRQVQVKRQWPNAIEVVYQEELPVAIWGQHYLNHEGRVLNVEQQVADLVLPELTGPDASAETVMSQYNSLGRILDSLGLKITRLALADRGAWTLELNTGLQLQLGKGALSEKLMRFDRVYKALKKYQQRIASVDLRYSNGVAVSWKEKTTG